MSTRGLCTALGLMLGLTVAGTPADANNQPAAYKWVDEQGVTHYGDSIPPQYAERELHLLNKQGVEVGHSDAAKTPEQLAAEARTHEASLKQQQHDSFLIATYTSVKDIETLRDVRLDQLNGQRTAAEAYVENLHSRLVALQDRAKHFRPYTAQARRMPDDLAEDLVHTLNEMRTQSNALTAKNQEVAAVKAQFDTDIERYRELHDAHARR
jgi:Domain of unknown function (DUF4124)